MDVNALDVNTNDSTQLTLPQHRFVWSTLEDLCTITCATNGHDGTVNGLAASIFSQLNHSPDLVQQFQLSHPDFIKSSITAGWIAANGILNGAITEIHELHQLKRLQIELTTRCNLECSYCYSESGPQSKSTIPIDLIFNILDEAKELGCTWIDFTGGEFFIYKEWKRALSHARRAGLIVTIHTNGMALTEDNISYIVNYGVRSIQVSLDSHLSPVHDKLRGLSGALVKTVKGIRLAKKAGIAVKVCVMAHQENKLHLTDTVKWVVEELKVPVMLDRIIKAGGELHAGIGLSTKDYYELIAPLINRNVLSTKICDNLSLNSFAKIEPACGVAHNFAYITADREVALCPTMTSRDRSFFAGPSLDNVSLTFAWLHSDYFNKYRGINCKNVKVCPSANKCGGGCRSNAYLETGELSAPDELACNLNKNRSVSFVNFANRYSRGEYSIP